MPLKKKKLSGKKFLIWALIIAIIVLMIIYFPPTQNMIEIELFP